MERPKGVGGVPGQGGHFLIFWVSFGFSFLIVLWKDFRLELGPKTAPKLVPKFTDFGSSFGPHPRRTLLEGPIGKISGKSVAVG